MKYLLSSIIMLVVFNVSGQTTFNRTYPKGNYDYASAVLERPDGKYLLVGSSRSANSSDYDVNILLVDSAGNLIWDKFLGQYQRLEFGCSVTKTTDNNYLISGSVSMQNHAQPYLVKISPNGNLIWEKIINTSTHEKAYAINKTSDNHFFFVGNNKMVTGTSKLYKLNLTGDTIWVKKAGLINSNFAIQTADSGFALIGSINNTLNNQDIAFQKMDQNGNISWTRTYGASQYDNANALLQTSDKRFLIAGLGIVDTLRSHAIPKTFLIRTNILGDTIWTKRYDLGAPVYMEEIPNHKGFIFSSTESVGQSFPGSTIYYNHITRVDTAGNIFWTKKFSGRVYEPGNNIFQTSDGGFLLTGSIEGVNFMEDINLVKLDSTGNVVMGIKVKPTVKDLEVNSFPNPVQSELTIHLTSKTNKQIDHIIIYNSLGQAILSMAPEKGNKVKIDLKNLPAGIYSFKLLTSTFETVTRKFIVSKN